MSPANTSVTWSYSWNPHGNPSTIIETRATDDSGNVEVPSDALTVNVGCPCSLWGANVTPAIVDSGDAGSIEVGVKFTSDVDGTVNGIRFYKASTNTGTHIGNLWTASGQLLATATFASETASGWQQVTFSQPVPISANTTYIASYFAPKGHYSATEQYFLSPPIAGGAAPDAKPLHALRSTATTSNGVYAYAGGSSFPNLTYNAENYWVDVSFTPSGPLTAPGQLTNVSATAGYSSASISWTPSTAGGSATSYTVTPYIGTVAQAPVTVTGTPVPTTTTINGLTNGTAYTFTVTATNSAGTGAASAQSNAVTPTANASLVTNGGFEGGMAGWTTAGIAQPVVATAVVRSGAQSALLGTLSGPEPKGDSSLSQNITVPATGNTTLSYWYWPQTADDICSGAACTYDWTEAQIRSTTGTTLATVYKGNTNTKTWTNVTYDLTPYAGQTVQLWFNTHQDGGGDPTGTYLDDVSVTNSLPAPPTAPAAPTNVSAVGGNASATVSWTTPANGGSTITGYTVTPYVGTTAETPTTVSGSATSATLTGLTNGTSYTFTVAAANAVGTGAVSASSNVVTPAIPSSTPAFVQQVAAHSGNVSSLSVTPSVSLTAGNRLVVMVGIWASGNPTASSVTDASGDVFTEALHFTASDGTEMSVWTAPITGGGGAKPAIKVTPTAKADIGVEAMEYSGLSTAAGAAAIDQMSHASGTTGSSSATVQSGATPATTAAAELALGFYVDSGFGDTLTAGSSFTQRGNVSKAGDIEFLAEDAQVALGAMPNAPVGTGSKTTWLMATLVFKAA
jgi:hypothetical protein